MTTADGDLVVFTGRDGVRFLGQVVSGDADPGYLRLSLLPEEGQPYIEVLASECRPPSFSDARPPDLRYGDLLETGGHVTSVVPAAPSEGWWVSERRGSVMIDWRPTGDQLVRVFS